MKRIYLLNLLIAVYTCAEAQVSPKASFQSINQVGVLEGEAGSAFQLQTINGIRYKTYSAGIGVGLDYYFERAVPVFIDLRKNILAKQNSPFVYLEGGIPFTWTKSKDDIKEPEYHHQLMYEAGIGYNLPIGKNARFLMSAGYNYRSFTEYSYPTYWIYAYPVQKKQRFDYELRRISIKMGLEF